MTDPTEDDTSTVALSGILVSPPPTASFVLTVVAGPDLGKTFLIDPAAPGLVIVGQGSGADFVLTDRMVSRRHVELECVGEELRVADAHSKNGSRVNGAKIIEANLLGGEKIQIGQTVISVELVAKKAAGPLSTRVRFGEFVGASTEIRRVYPLLERLSQSDVPVIIEGETGTGKEVIAESLHEEGLRSGKPYVVFDCTAVTPTLVEATLFGHERGAFTGAVSSKKGVFEEAHGGTLFIDEIGDLDVSLQPKLLRAIERSEVKRVGGHKVTKVDVRIIAATRRDLDREIQAGRFRDDLFHRLAVGRIHLPPLRRRCGDVTVLAHHFGQALGGPNTVIPRDVLRRWEDYQWPGNARELRNSVARYLALGDSSTLADGNPDETAAGLAENIHSIEEYVARALQHRLPLAEARKELVREFDHQYMERVLRDHGGNATRTAAFLGVARRYFHLLRQKSRKLG